MTWTKLDDGFYDNPKVVAAGNEAAGAYARMLSYCGRHLTDGRVPEPTARSISRPVILSRLEEHGFIKRNGSGWVIPDYLSFNPSKKKILAKRARDSARKAP